MKRVTKILPLFVLLPLLALAAVATLTSSGNWSNSGNWSGGNIADNITEEAIWNNNIGTVTIQNGDNYTISNMDMKNGNTLTIDAGGNLDIGNISNPFNLTTGNTATINIDGSLEIWGDLNVGNTLTLNVTGSLIIHGNVVLGNSGALDISGNVTIDGNFTGGNGTDVNVDGSLDVGGTIDTGNGSTLTGSGTVTGNCIGDPVFCAGAPLPIELIFFNARSNESVVNLNWATAQEENFDYFLLERSANGENFTEVVQISGSGNSFERHDYTYTDNFPMQGISYYRLTSVDFDGYTEVFDYVAVQMNDLRDDFSVFPNPVEGASVTIQTNFEPGKQSELIIFNSLGRVEARYPVSHWRESFETNNLEAGTYLFKLISDNGVMVKRVLIR